MNASLGVIFTVAGFLASVPAFAAMSDVQTISPNGGERCMIGAAGCAGDGSLSAGTPIRGIIERDYGGGVVLQRGDASVDQIWAGGSLLGRARSAGDNDSIAEVANVAPVPVPAAFTLLLTALGGVALIARRRSPGA
jgi:hypothetical protein